MSKPDAFFNFLKKVSEWLVNVALVPIFLMFVISMVDIFGAKLFNRPVTGSQDYNGLALLLCASLCFGWGEAHDSNTRVEFVLKHIPNKARQICLAISALLCTAFYCILTYSMTSYGLHIIRANSLSGTLRIPLGPFYLVIAVGFFFVTLILLAKLILAVREVFKS